MSESDDLLVTVVIPTFGRPHLVTRAIMSALHQTLRQIEIIVVIDGPDPDTHSVISRIGDRRVRNLTLPSRSGPGAARNAGIEAAKAPWLAFLDDDDEWLPEKLARQIAETILAKDPFLILGTRAYIKTPFATYIWPTRRPRLGEHLSDYLFTRKSLFMGEGWYTTPSLLTRTELARRTPFDEAMEHGGDNDWLLRAASQQGARYEVLWEPLCIVRYEQDERQSITNTTHEWKSSLQWAARQRHLFTATAYAGFCLKASHRAAAGSEWHAFFVVLWEAFRHGRPTLVDFIVFLGIWTTPRKLRRKLRAKYYLWRSSRDGSGDGAGSIASS